MSYTQLALVGVAATVLLDLAVLRTRLLLRRAFWVAYAIIVFFQLVTNGVLTGFEIVRYSGDTIVGSSEPVFIGDGRIAYAPVEDLLFGFALVVQTLIWWVWWGRRGVQYQPVAGPPVWRTYRSGGAASPDGPEPGR
jgi:lycopene cyclase domain-containing protein